MSFGWKVGLHAMALALAPILGTQAAECIVSTQMPEQFIGKPPSALHASSNLSVAHTATHGQILLGKETPRYLYHLPVFMTKPTRHPHNFQVVVAVSPVDESDDAVARYKQDRAQHQGKLYTAVPPTFDQMKLIGDQPLRELNEVALVRGHFEKSSARPLGGAANLEIERIVYFNEFNPQAQPAAALAYLLMGTQQEQYMVHLLSGPPDFDQVLEVSVDGNSLSEEQLGKGVFVVFEQRRNQSDERLNSGDAITCTMDDAASQVTLRVVAEHYCEVGELAQAVSDSFGEPRGCDEQ